MRPVRLTKARGHKYRAKPTVIDGIRFASQKEARRYQELKLLEKSGEIRGLTLQPRYPLWAHTGVVADEPVPVGEYRADFAYELRFVRGINPVTRQPSIEWEDVVEDVKGFKTPLYRWKKKHVELQYGITVKET